MNDERVEALEEFERQANFEKTCYRALQSVLSRNPISLMVVYEKGDGTVALTTVPFSPQLARGLSDAAYELMWAQTAEENLDVDED